MMVTEDIPANRLVVVENFLAFWMFFSCPISFLRLLKGTGRPISSSTSWYSGSEHLLIISCSGWVRLILNGVIKEKFKVISFDTKFCWMGITAKLEIAWHLGGIVTLPIPNFKTTLEVPSGHTILSWFSKLVA